VILLFELPSISYWEHVIASQDRASYHGAELIYLP
jgi:hypothetical protein